MNSPRSEANLFNMPGFIKKNGPSSDGIAYCFSLELRETFSGQKKYRQTAKAGLTFCVVALLKLLKLVDCNCDSRETETKGERKRKTSFPKLLLLEEAEKAPSKSTLCLASFAAYLTCNKL